MERRYKVAKDLLCKTIADNLQISQTLLKLSLVSVAVFAVVLSAVLALMFVPKVSGSLAFLATKLNISTMSLQIFIPLIVSISTTATTATIVGVLQSRSMLKVEHEHSLSDLLKIDCKAQGPGRHVEICII